MPRSADERGVLRAGRPGGVEPKLLIVDLILAGNQRPRMRFACFLLGGMGLGVAVGLLDVLVLHADAIKTQGHASAGLDLALGIPLLIVGALLLDKRLFHRRRRPHLPAADKPPSKLQTWAHRVLHEPRYGLAVLIGAAVGTPGVNIFSRCTTWSPGNIPPWCKWSR